MLVVMSVCTVTPPSLSFYTYTYMYMYMYMYMWQCVSCNTPSPYRHNKTYCYYCTCFADTMINSINNNYSPFQLFLYLVDQFQLLISVV